MTIDYAEKHVSAPRQMTRLVGAHGWFIPGRVEVEEGLVKYVVLFSPVDVVFDDVAFML